MVESTPNILLLMCDDLGYGDTGFNGNDIIQTPSLDKLRSEGAHLTRFFAGAPVCSPTRGTCLTGRHHYRYGITTANDGKLPTQEVTLSKICKESGYRTGHFGKWHLGTLTTTSQDGRRAGPENTKEYSPPWIHDFDVCFSTESMVPTWDPMISPDGLGPNDPNYGTPGESFGTSYWNQNGERVEDNLQGDDSRIIVDRVEPFIRDCVENSTPFLSVVWFHAPHRPVVAGEKYRKKYSNYHSEEQHYYGCVTAMDEQVGRINQLIKDLGVEDDTIIWFCSDNGPEGSEALFNNGRSRGSTGGLRGRKGSLYNGGTGVPALVKWPGLVAPGTEYQTPCSTLDYFPTIADLLQYEMPDDRPIDGISLIPIIKRETKNRNKAIPYRFRATRERMAGAPTYALIAGKYKLLTNLADTSEDVMFDLYEDMEEENDVIGQNVDRANRMREQLIKFIESCRESHSGADYSEPYQPINEFEGISETWRDAAFSFNNDNSSRFYRQNSN